MRVEESLKKNSYQQEIRNNEIKNLEFSKKACEEIKFSRETDTVKKLESVEKQLVQLEEKKQAIENDIIELINDVDNISKELEGTKKRLSFIKKKFVSSKENIEKAIEELEAQRSKLSEKTGALVKKVDKDTFEMYTRILKSHTDPVARLIGRSCSGCNMEVSAMDYEALRSGRPGAELPELRQVVIFRENVPAKCIERTYVITLEYSANSMKIKETFTRNLK